MALTPDQLVAKSKTESSIQTAFFAGLGRAKLEPSCMWIHAIPSGGERNAIVAGRMKGEGVRAGIWDVHVPIRRQGYAGMYIEFKRPEHRRHVRGGLTEEQLAFGEYANHEGYRMKVAYTWREAAEALCKYLEVEYVESAWNT